MDMDWRELKSVVHFGLHGMETTMDTDVAMLTAGMHIKGTMSNMLKQLFCQASY